jgi:AcrR family transcriptional regulator
VIEAALDAAQATFYRDGYDAASLTTLTAAMGINPPSFYAAFGSKEKLFNRVLERYHGAFYGLADELFKRDIPTLEALERFLDMVAAMHTSRRPMQGCLIVNSSLVLCRDNSSMEQCLKAVVAKNQKLIMNRLDHGKRAGDIGREINSREVAVYVNGLMHAMASIARTTQSRSAVRSIAKLGKSSLGNLLGCT